MKENEVSKRADGYYWVRKVGANVSEPVIAFWDEMYWGFDDRIREDEYFEVLSEKLEPPHQRMAEAIRLKRAEAGDDLVTIDNPVFTPEGVLIDGELRIVTPPDEYVGTTVFGEPTPEHMRQQRVDASKDITLEFTNIVARASSPRREHNAMALIEQLVAGADSRMTVLKTAELVFTRTDGGGESYIFHSGSVKVAEDIIVVELLDGV